MGFVSLNPSYTDCSPEGATLLRSLCELRKVLSLPKRGARRQKRHPGCRRSRSPRIPLRCIRATERQAMQLSQFHYLPMTPGFFSILVGIFAILFILLQLGALR